VRFTNLTDEELAAAPDDTLPTQPQPVYAVQTNQRNPFTGREPDLIIAPNDPRQTIPQFNTSAQTLTDVANIEDSHDTKDKTNTTPQPPPTHIQHRTPGAHQLGFAFLFIEHEPQAHVHPQ
jgi:hypothetical protein